MSENITTDAHGIATIIGDEDTYLLDSNGTEYHVDVHRTVEPGVYGSTVELFYTLTNMSTGAQLADAYTADDIATEAVKLGLHHDSEY